MKRITHPYLFLFVGVCVIVLLITSMGEALWGTTDGVMHWTEKLFYGVCHQLPDRTYTIDGALMAVNTRCFGIFLGIAAGWAAIPFVGRHLQGSRWAVLFLVVAICLQIVDYLGNLVELWQNTNHSRALLGALFGTALSISVSDLFIKRKSNN